MNSLPKNSTGDNCWEAGVNIIHRQREVFYGGRRYNCLKENYGYRKDTYSTWDPDLQNFQKKQQHKGKISFGLDRDSGEDIQGRDIEDIVNFAYDWLTLKRKYGWWINTQIQKRSWSRNRLWTWSNLILYISNPLHNITNTYLIFIWVFPMTAPYKAAHSKNEVFFCSKMLPFALKLSKIRTAQAPYTQHSFLLPLSVPRLSLLPSLSIIRFELICLLLSLFPFWGSHFQIS